LTTALPFKDQTIAFYCAGLGKETTAAQAAADLGYEVGEGILARRVISVNRGAAQGNP